jgi:ATP-dependent protease ClpP protease subunit
MKSLFILGLTLLMTFPDDSKIVVQPVIPSADELLLTENNTINFRGVVTNESVQTAMLEVQKLNLRRGIRNYPIYIVFDSPGGSIDAGNNFINFVKMYKNIHTVGLDAASMASAIMQQLPGKRYVTSTSVLMFHRASIRGLGGQVETGELETRLALIKKMVLALENGNANRIGISLEEYKKRVVNEWYVYGLDNVEQGTADKVVNIRCSDKLIQSRSVTYEYSLFGSRKSTYSGCPLFRSPLSDN